MNSDSHSEASARLATARSAANTASENLRMARGTTGEFHAAVQQRAAEDRVEAQTGWLAWADRVDEDR
jgi:hypothetical protein